jgi:GTP-binding protein
VSTVTATDDRPPALFAGLEYALSAHRLGDLPPPGAPEVAFAGRSNAGKSSAINALAARTRLAFVSKTPGRTQQINFFRLRGGGFLVDLPGYGYAKVPLDLRAHWEKTLAAYLQRRESLAGLVLIMDARHGITALDAKMIDWFAPSGRPIHALLTKADKLSRSEAAAMLRAVSAELAQRSPRYGAQLFSSLKRTGVQEAEAAIAPWLSAV